MVQKWTKVVKITSKLKKIEKYETNRKIKTEEVLGWSQSLSKNFWGSLSTYLAFKPIETFADQKKGLFQTLNKTSGWATVQKWSKKWPTKVPIGLKAG